jgi:hypothetical protein
LSYWDGNYAFLRLSREGQEGLKGIFDGEFIRVFIEWSDEHGLWAVRDEQKDGAITVVLIRWDYLVTAMLDVVPAVADFPRPIGFK